jgi:hypothetical protein
LYVPPNPFHAGDMPNWVWFIVGAIASTFVGALFFAVLSARGYNPIASAAGFFAPRTVQAPAATVGG